MKCSTTWWSMAALALIVCAPARAAIFCVTNETELRAALQTISTTFTAGANEIRLTQRVFFTGTMGFSAQPSGPSGDLRVSGGWASGASTACDTQTIDARLTALDAQGTSAVLNINRSSVSGSNTPLIAVSNLTVRNGLANDAVPGLHVVNSFGPVEVDNVISHGHRAPTSFYDSGIAITLDSSQNNIRLRNALTYDNQGSLFNTPLASVLLTSLSLSPARVWYVNNNTFVGANATDPVLRLQSDGNFWVSNNVIVGTARYLGSITGAGAATAPQLRQYFNQFGSLPTVNQATVLAELANDTALAPLNTSNWEPLDTSPTINSALNAPPGGEGTRDVYGQPRVFGGLLDRGAVELQRQPDAAFANQFE